MRKLNLILVLGCALCVFVPASAQRKFENGTDVIRAMHDKYSKNWYSTLTFVQKTTNFKPDGTSEVSTWYEALSAPGKLRIDIDPMSDGNGILFVNDKQISIKGGKVGDTRDRIHPLLVLGFDVYKQAVETTVAKLEKLKFDLSVVHDDAWQGEPVIVVGAKDGDVKSPQFWITRKTLLFVRMIQPGGKDGKSTNETQFNKYYQVKRGGWVSPEVVFMVDGKRVVTEEYSDMKTDVELDPMLFDPDHWTTVHWR